MTSKFSWTAAEESAASIKKDKISPLTNFAKVEDTATSCILKNKKCGLGQGEVLSFQCTPVKNISTKQDVQYPARVGGGIQYVVRLDEILRTYTTYEQQGTQVATGDVVQDDPIVMYLTVRHPSSSAITPDVITSVFKRLLGAITRDDGTFRFDDLMLSALEPDRN